MPVVKRVDRSGKLGKVQRTPQGGIKVPASIAKVGILEYWQADGSVLREYNPPEVLAAAAESLRDAPVTNDHPPEAVTADNYAQYNRGSVSGEPVFADDHLSVPFLVIQGKDLIEAINAGKTEVSAGYSADVDYTPGVTPSGEAYDGIRRSITYNHVAVVDEGRAGPTVRLMLDSARNVLVASPGTTADTSEQDLMDIEQLKAALAVAQADLEKANGKAEALTAEVTQVKADLAQATDPARLDAAVSARIELIDSARKVLGAEFKADGLSADEIRKAVVAKAYPSIKLDGKSADAVAGMFETAVVKADNGSQAESEIRSALSNVGDAKDAPKDLDSVRAEMLARNAARGKSKLGK